MAPAHSSSQVRAVSPLIRNGGFRSIALKREMKYRVYLPHAYSASARRYPVLYLLHGLYGDYRNWDSNTQFAQYMAGRDWIVVMPDAGNSWYANSASQADNRFEDYIAKDLVREVDGKYRTIRECQGARDRRTIHGRVWRDEIRAEISRGVRLSRQLEWGIRCGA
jgi:S-formylglutathione hydrolase FrmB